MATSSCKSWPEADAIIQALSSSQRQTAGDLKSDRHACANPDNASAEQGIFQRLEDTKSIAPCSPNQSVDDGPTVTPTSLQRVTETARGELHDHLEKALALCRRHRFSLSVILIDGRVFSKDLEVAQQHISHRLEQVVSTAGAEESVTCFLPLTLSRFAIAIEGYDCPATVDFARRLVECIRQVDSQSPTQGNTDSQVSAGVATVGLPLKSLPVDQLVEAAERCLFASRSSGGNIVKSIDIF